MTADADLQAAYLRAVERRRLAHQRADEAYVREVQAAMARHRDAKRREQLRVVSDEPAPSFREMIIREACEP